MIFVVKTSCKSHYIKIKVVTIYIDLSIICINANWAT